MPTPQHSSTLLALLNAGSDGFDLPQVLLDALPVPVFVKDRTGRYLTCNPAFEQYLGRSRDEIVGRTVFELSPPDLATRYHARDQELLDHPGVQIYETQVQPAQGMARQVVFHKATFAGPDGQVAGLIGAILDVTEVRRAEAAVRASETRLGTIVDAALTGIIVVEAATRRIVSANRYALELIGLPAEAVIGRRCHQFVCAAEEAQCPVLDLCRTVDRAERVLVTGTGQRIPVLKTVRAFEEDGRSFLVESFIDIRALKETQSSLARTNASLRAVIDTSPLAILALGEEGRMVIWNRAAEQMFGWTADEVLGRPNPIVPPEYRHEHQAILDEAIEGQPVTGFETTRCRKDGARIAVSLSTAALVAADGRNLGVLAILEEIGERKRLQAERELLIQELTNAAAHVKTLSGILPICMHCKKIRDDQGYWSQVDHYVREHSDAVFSHGLCPDCEQKHYGHLG